MQLDVSAALVALVGAPRSSLPFQKDQQGCQLQASHRSTALQCERVFGEQADDLQDILREDAGKDSILRATLFLIASGGVDTAGEMFRGNVSRVLGKKGTKGGPYSKYEIGCGVPQARNTARNTHEIGPKKGSF